MHATPTVLESLVLHDIVMAYVVMTDTVMAYIAMAYVGIPTVPREPGLTRYSDGPYHMVR